MLKYTYTLHFSLFYLILQFCFLNPGPLFSFDVHDDIRLVNDATVEKDEVKMWSSLKTPKLKSLVFGQLT